METVTITVSGRVNTGKSTLARLILRILRTLKGYGITANLSQEEIDEGYDVDFFEKILEDSLITKINVVIDTAQLNRKSVSE